MAPPSTWLQRCYSRVDITFSLTCTVWVHYCLSWLPVYLPTTLVIRMKSTIEYSTRNSVSPHPSHSAPTLRTSWAFYWLRTLNDVYRELGSYLRTPGCSSGVAMNYWVASRRGLCHPLSHPTHSTSTSTRKSLGRERHSSWLRWGSYRSRPKRICLENSYWLRSTISVIALVWIEGLRRVLGVPRVYMEWLRSRSICWPIWILRLSLSLLVIWKRLH